MARQAFHLTCGLASAQVPNSGSDQVFWSRFKTALFFALLITLPMSGSPIVGAETRTWDFTGLTMSTPAWQATTPAVPNMSMSTLDRLPYYSETLDLFQVAALMEDTSGLRGPSQNKGMEGYPYILLTICLMLLALRPGHMALSGKH